MIWAHLTWWPFAMAFCCIGIWAAWHIWRMRRDVALHIDTAQKTYTSGWHQRNFWRAVSITFAIGGMAIACLRPQWGIVTAQIDAHTKDVFIALDLSQSMLATDVYPNRLAIAQESIEHLLQTLPYDRVGLILFADKPTLQAPLTQDTELVRSFIAQAPLLVGGGGTRFDTLLQMAAHHLVDGSAHQKILIILSDGEDFSTNLSPVIQELKQAGITIIALGVGTTQGAPIPLPNGEGFIKDAQANPVISRLNPETLEQLAHATNGIYFSLENKQQALGRIQTIVEMAERGKLGNVTVERYIDRYSAFMTLALASMLIGMLL